MQVVAPMLQIWGLSAERRYWALIEMNIFYQLEFLLFFEKLFS